MSIDDNSEAGCFARGLYYLIALAFFIYGLVGAISGYTIIPWENSSTIVDGAGARSAGIGLMLCSVGFASMLMNGENHKACLTVSGVAFGIGLILIIVGISSG